MKSFAIIGLALIVVAAILLAGAGLGLLPRSDANYSAIIVCCFAVLAWTIYGTMRLR